MKWLSKLGAGSCQRPQCRRPRTPHASVREECGSTAHDAWWIKFSIKWNESSTKLWLCAVLNWSTNTASGDSGHSPSQWVLGRSLRLPFQLLSRARHRDDFAHQRRVAMYRDRSSAPGTRAFLSSARSANNTPSQVRFAVGDQVMYWRGNNKRKSQWSMRWLGPGIVFGHEGHRNAVVEVQFASESPEISVCCLRPWHVNGRTGRSTRQHCH